MSAPLFRRLGHRILVASGPVMLLLVALYRVLVWICESLWFESLGYGAHFHRLFAWRAGAFVVGALLFGVWTGINAQIAWRNAAARAVPLSFFQHDDAERLIRLEDKLHLDRYRRRATLVIVGALSWGAGLGFSAHYATFVRAFWAQSTGIHDPASNFDLAFFLFELPFYAYLSRFLLAGIVAALLLVMAIYGYEEIIGPRTTSHFNASPGRGARVSRPAARHLAILWSMLLLWKGLDCVIGVPQSFVSSGNVATRVFDTIDISFGWTSAGLFAFSAPLVALLSGLSIAREPRYRTLIPGLVWMLGASLVPSLLPLVIGRSTQNGAWTDAIARHIRGTRRAWGLENVETRSLSRAFNAPFRPVQNTAEVASPLALWPAVAARSAFNRRLDARGSAWRVARVSLEREGETLIYRGLALPPQPMATTSHPVSWRALHGRAPRGLLLEMEATRATPAAAPIFLAETPVSALVGAPEWAVFGVGEPFWAGGAPIPLAGDSDAWILTGAETGSGETGDRELDFQQDSGVPLRGLAVKALLAARFFEPKLARGTADGDRILWHRDAAERCREVAPFLDWPSAEAHPVLVGDANLAAPPVLKWIVPGLAWSEDYPDSATPAAPGIAPVTALEGAAPGATSGRQGAIGVVDARSGALTLYRLDEDEPFTALYARAFPGLFALPTALPEEIRAALRPSPSLLTAQALIWARYHENDARSWISRETAYRPLFLSFPSGTAALRPLAAGASGEWNFMAYARPQSQAVSSAAPPLSAILGADERAFRFSAKTRFVQWRTAAPLALPAILNESPASEVSGSALASSPTLLSVAPRLDAAGEALGLIVTRGAASLRETQPSGAPSQLQLSAAIQISGGEISTKAGNSAKKGNSAVAAPVPPPLASAASRLDHASAAWRDLRKARQNGHWAEVAEAEKRLDAALSAATGTR